MPWPPRSPIFNPLDFFFSGYVKEHIYIPPLPRTVNELKECIFKIIASVNSIMLRRTWQEFQYRVYVCHVTWGANMEYLQLLILNLQDLEYKLGMCSC
jgi:hypothetical protein